MKPVISVVATMTVLVMGSLVLTAHAQSGYQPEPVLQARDLVATELLKGPHYTVGPRVLCLRLQRGSSERRWGVDGRGKGALGG